jgi:GrpB protein
VASQIFVGNLVAKHGGDMNEDELRAVRIGELLPLAGKIEIADSDPAWPNWFARQEARIRGALGERVLLLEHVGSTSVPGLAAKPRIDILLGRRPARAAAGVTRAAPAWFHTGVLVDAYLDSLEDMAALTAELAGFALAADPAAAPPAGPAAGSEAPDTPNLSPIGSSYPQGSGQDLRAVSTGASYQRSFPASDAGGAQLSVGVIPQGTELRGVPVGAELVASGSLATGGGGGGTLGAHGWLSPGRLNLALYLVGGAVAGQSPPEHTGVDGALLGSAGLEYLAGGETRDTPRVTLGGAVLAGVQGPAQIGDPDGASTYISHATTIGGIVSANIALRYGAAGAPAAGIPRFAVWGELSPSHTSGGTTIARVSPGGPAMLRPTGASSSVGGAAGITVNLPFTASGLQVISVGAFGGIRRQWDTVGGDTAPSTQLQLGAGLGYAGRF